MPSKLPRRRDASYPVPNGSLSTIQVDLEPGPALLLGGAIIAHGTLQASAQVTGTVIMATGRALEASIQSFSQCFSAFMGYMKEREITSRMISQEREITARVVTQEQAATDRVHIWSTTVIAEAEARTEDMRIQASLVLATIQDRKDQRKSKLTVIHEFMKSYQSWNVMLTDALASRADRMPLHERELLQKQIEPLLQRARDMERNITEIAVTL